MKMGLGEQETRLLAYAHLRKLWTIKTGQLTTVLGLTPVQERKLFSRLARGGLIAKVRRGLYLIPPRLPLGGSWSPDEILALNTLIEDQQGTYQICGPNAFNRYGFDQQMPTRVYAYNDRLSGERKIGSVALTLIKVAKERLGDVEEVETADGVIAVYSSRVRTLIDAVYDWSRFNSLPRAYSWIQNELTAKRVSGVGLVGTTLRYGDVATIRRIAVLLQRFGANETLLRKLENALRPTTASIAWIPTKPKTGTLSRRWGVVLNQ